MGRATRSLCSTEPDGETLGASRNQSADEMPIIRAVRFTGQQPMFLPELCGGRFLLVFCKREFHGSLTPSGIAQNGSRVPNDEFDGLAAVEVTVRLNAAASLWPLLTLQASKAADRYFPDAAARTFPGENSGLVTGESHMTFPLAIWLAAWRSGGFQPWDSAQVPSHGRVCCMLCGNR